MKPLRRLWSKLTGILFRGRREADLRAEIQSHIDMQTEDNLRAGMNPAEARRQARLKFGSVESAKEDYRDRRSFRTLETFIRDIRYALRTLAKSPVLLRGRLFTDEDTVEREQVVVINERMAEKHWPGANPIGARIDIDYFNPDFAAPPRRIIGIVGDVHTWRLDRGPDPMMYLAQAQAPDGLTRTDARIIPLTWVVRSETDPFAMRTVIEDELRKASGGLPVARVRSMGQVVSESLARSDFNTILLTAFAAVALLLAAIGVYGLVSYSVEQRRREIGVRMALGAAPQQVRNEVVSQGARVSLIGLALGVTAALALTRFLSSLVFGTTTSNPVVIGGVGVLLCLTTLLASYLPSRRATRVNPVEALRHE